MEKCAKGLQRLTGREGGRGRRARVDRCGRDCEVERIGKHTWCAELIRNRVSRIASGRSASFEPPPRAPVLCREIDYTLDNAGFSPEERYVSDGVSATAARPESYSRSRSFGYYRRFFLFTDCCRRSRWWVPTRFHSGLITSCRPNPLVRIPSRIARCCDPAVRNVYTVILL